MELKICHLYPDVLNLNGDAGNLACLQKRLLWRGMEASVTGVALGENPSLADFDLFFMGGDESFQPAVMLADLQSGKAASLRAAIEDGKVFLAICGGYQLLGGSYELANGEKFDLIGALDASTVCKKERLIGNCLFRMEDGTELVSFENHAGYTTLGSGAKPLGLVQNGKGNNGSDGTEGARVHNLFASYGHGPLLPKNPAFADLLLQTALCRRYGKAELAPLDDTLENSAHDGMVNRLKENK